MTSLLDQYIEHVHEQTCFRSGNMESARTRNILLRRQGFNGEVMPRHVYAEQRVAAGNVEIDYKRKHYKNTETGAVVLFPDVTLALVDYTEWLLSLKVAA
jgi:hypothetical protein